MHYFEHGLPLQMTLVIGDSRETDMIDLPRPGKSHIRDLIDLANPRGHKRCFDLDLEWVKVEPCNCEPCETVGITKDALVEGSYAD